MIGTEQGLVDLSVQEAAALLGCPPQSATREVRRIAAWMATAMGNSRRWAPRSGRGDRAYRGFIEGFRKAVELANHDFAAFEQLAQVVAEQSARQQGGKEGP